MAANGRQDINLLCPIILTVCCLFLFLLAGVSFLNLIAIAVDRLLAIALHLRYRELVTSKRVVIALASVWITSGVFAFLFVAVNNRRAITIVICEFVGLLLTTITYIHIYRAVIHHQNHIHSQLQQRNAQAMELLREKRAAFNAVHVIFVACYLPNLCCAILLITNSFQISLWLAMHAKTSIVRLNSSLNPLVYCWRYREIHQIMKSTLKKIFLITET